MNVILCVDDSGGMMFNNRRQSQDVRLREYVVKMCDGATLRMNEYSAKQFDLNAVPNVRVDEDFLSKAQKGDYCFVEDKELTPYESSIEKIILFKWNRLYPSDLKFDIPLEQHGWECIFSDKFQGNSHDEITVEVYER